MILKVNSPQINISFTVAFRKIFRRDQKISCSTCFYINLMSLLISLRSTSSININCIKLKLIGTIPGPRRVGVKHAPKSPNRQTLKSYNLASPWTIRSTWRAKSLLLLKECMLNSDTSSIPADSRHHYSVKATSISAFTDHYLNTVQSKLRTLPTAFTTRLISEAIDQ